MIENHQIKTILSAFFTSKIFGKISYSGEICTEDSSEIKLMKELALLNWEIEGDFYRSENLLNSNECIIANQKFLLASLESDGYQIQCSPLTFIEIEFLFNEYFTTYEPKISYQTSTYDLRIYLKKSNLDLLLVHANNLIDEDLENNIKIKIQEVSEKQKLQEILPYLKFFEAGQRLTKISEELFLKNSSTSCHTATYYLCQANINFLNFLKEAEIHQLPNLYSKISKSLIKKIKNPLPKLKIINRERFLKLLIEYATNYSLTPQRILLFKILNKIYPENTFIESTYQRLTSHNMKIQTAHQLFRNKNYIEARIEFEEILNNLQGENSKEQSHYYETLTYINLKLKNFDDAKKSKELTNNTFFLELRANYLEGEICKNLGFYEDALKYYEKTQNLAPTLNTNLKYTLQERTSYYLFSLYREGCCYLILQQYENALKAFLDTYELYEQTKMNLQKPFGFIQILYIQNILRKKYEETIFSTYSKKIKKLNILNQAIELIYEKPEILLPKTFKLFQSGINEFIEETQLISYFLQNKNLNKLIILCDELIKNNVNFTAAILEIINTLSTLDLTLYTFPTTDKTILCNFCNKILETSSPHESYYQNALFILHNFVPNKVILILESIILNQFELYLAIPKPNSTQLHYDLAQLLESKHPEESLLSYQKVLELGFKKRNFNKFKVSSIRMLSLAFLNNKKKEELSESAFQKIFQLVNENSLFCKEIAILLEQNSDKTLCDEIMLSLAQLTKPPAISPMYEKFIQRLLEKEYKTALDYYLKIKHLLETKSPIHQKFVETFKEKKIFLQENGSELIALAQSIFSSHNPSNKAYSSFSEKLKQAQRLIFYNQLLNFFQGKKQLIGKKIILYKIAEILIQENIAIQQEKIIALTIYVLENPTVHFDKQMVYSLFELLKFDLSVMLALIEYSSKFSNNELFMQATLEHVKQLDEDKIKHLDETVLNKLLPLIDKYSDHYRKIFNRLYHNEILELPIELFQIFKMLTDQFGEDAVYLTGSRVHSLITHKPFTSTDLDFIVICDDEAIKILCNKLEFEKKENLPGISLYIKKIGDIPNEILLEVVHVKLNPKLTIIEQLKMNAEMRDFTICALFLNIFGIVFDFFNGVEDVKNQQLKSIQPALESFKKDSSRLLRAIKYCMNGYHWDADIRISATGFRNHHCQKFLPHERKHLYKLIKKHLFNADDSYKKTYIEYLQKYHLWTILFNYHTRMQLKVELNLPIPYEQCPRNSNEFFQDNEFKNIAFDFNPFLK